ncbi:hypothetical protein D3C87_2137980 [compost metagenome]
MEGVLKVLLDQCANLLRLDVIGVEVAGRKHIGTDHDAALHLAAETGSAGQLVHVGDILAGYA